MLVSRSLRRLAFAGAASFALLAGAAAQTLTIGVRAGPESIDPHYTATGTHAETLKHVFDTLVWSGDKLQLEPRLAESWTQTDPTTWEFKLRKGVKFHDGSDFTAEDVAASIKRMQILSGPNPTRIYVRRVKDTKVVDAHTIHVLTDGPAPTLPYDFIRLFITSAKATQGLTPENANEAFNSGKAAIGTGPYRFVSWTPREQFTMERFDQWWGGKQPWQRVVRREIPNDAARVAQLRAGQVDMIVRVPAADVATLERDAAFQVTKQETVYVFNIELDFREKSPQVSAKDGSPLPQNPFRDARVREAVDLAIDRPALAEIAMEGLGKPVTQMVTANIFGHDPELPALKPNVEKARALMKEAGYPNGFRVTFSFTNDRLPGDRNVGTAVAQMLARIGLEVNAAGQPAAVLFPARTRGDLSMVMSGWGTLTGEAHYTLSSVGHSNDPQRRFGAFNWRGYSNPKLDKLIQDAAVEIDEAKRKKLLQEANAEFMRERVSLPLVSISTAWALRKDRVKLERARTDEDTLAMDIAPAK
jgi:peptide/nickel transport system substrate-binding protein